MNPATNPRIHTFEGFLGGDCEIRWTEARTEIRTVYNEIIEGEEEVLVTIPARAFAALSLAVQRPRGGKWVTKWIQLRIWDVYRTQEWMNARIAKKGDRVRVTGTWRSRSTRDAKGEEKKHFHFEVKTFERLEPKVMREHGLRRTVARTA